MEEDDVEQGPATCNPCSIELYEAIIRQLKDDGFSKIADDLAAKAKAKVNQKLQDNLLWHSLLAARQIQREKDTKGKVDKIDVDSKEPANQEGAGALNLETE